MKKSDFTKNNKKLFLIVSPFATILIIFLNLTCVHSPIVGFAASVVYLLANSILLGRAIFEKEPPLLRYIYGILLLVTLLGFVGWLIMIIYNLDIPRLVMTLCTVSALSSFIGLKGIREEQDLKARVSSRWRIPKRSDVAKILYVSMIALLFYLLFLSRSEEVYTVRQVIHPLFMPIFFATTLFLLMIIFSSEKGEYKFIFIILHSLLSHSLFVIVFPAGDIGYQARILASSRLAFNNLLPHGWPPWPVESIPLQIWYLFRGINYQTALTVTFARMFNVDLYWSHSLLVPVLWGTFVPVAMFKMTKMLSGSEKLPFFSALIVSIFPTTIYYGALSIPNNLGYIFFLFSLLFMMKYLSSQENMTLFLTILFSFASFMSHYLAGAMAFTILLSAAALKKYQSINNKSSFSAKLFLLSSFIFCASLIPFALVYQRFFYPYRTSFSLHRLRVFALEEIIQWFILGEYVNYWLIARIFHVIAPLVGFLGMIYYFKHSRKQGTNKKYWLYALFLTFSFLIITIDYRIIKLLMVHVPFNEERLWVFRDLIAVPFVAIITKRLLAFLWEKSSNLIHRIRSQSFPKPLPHPNLKSIATYILALISISSCIIVLLSIPAGITISIYYGYPQYAPLQITSYELEAVKYIEENTNERYVVIADFWMIIAGQMIVGVHNPNAYYFRPQDPRGIALFIEMRNNTTKEAMKEAMKTNNATTAYFIIEKLRLGKDEYDIIIQQAQQNNLQTYKTFHHKDEEKLHIFYYRKSTD